MWVICSSTGHANANITQHVSLNPQHCYTCENCTLFHKARLMSCVLWEENKKGLFFFLHECCPAINPTIVKRSKWNGHLRLEEALRGTAADQSDQLPQTPLLPTKREKEKKTPNIQQIPNVKLRDKIASPRKYPSIPEIKSGKKNKKIQVFTNVRTSKAAQTHFWGGDCS